MIICTECGKEYSREDVFRDAHGLKPIDYQGLQAENKVLRFDNKNLKNEDLRLLRRIEQLQTELETEKEEAKRHYDYARATEQENVELQANNTHLINQAMVADNSLIALQGDYAYLKTENDRLKAESKTLTIENLVYFIETAVEIWPNFKDNLKEDWRKILNQCDNKCNDRNTGHTESGEAE